MTLDDSLRLFRKHGLDVLIAEAAVRSAEGGVRIAGAVPNPGWSLSASYAPTFQPNDPSCLQASAVCTPTSYSIGVSDSAAVEDSLSGKRELRLEVARSALAAAKMSRADAQRNLEFQVKAAYVQTAQAVLGLVFAKKVAASNVVTLEKFRTRFASGAINAGDLARVTTQKLESDQALALAVQTLRQARAALAFLIGVRGLVSDFDVDVRVLDFVPRAAIANASEASLLRLAFSHRPDLVSAGYQRAAAASGLSLAKRQTFPDIAISVTYTQGGWGGLGTNGPTATPTFTFGLSGTLPAFYQRQGELRQAEAQLDTSALQYAKIAAQVTNDVANAVAAERAARDQAKRMEGVDGLLDAAKKAFEITSLQYDKGAASLTDYLDAYRTFVATQTEQYADLTNYWTAVYQVEQAVGMEIR